ncbi:Imm8 family immunity protein [Treponema sp.]|uniref:Imm8 family immunity protein n=1 Tax=Treponema sp. TaxID=166 RepID=UPI003FA22D46
MKVILKELFCIEWEFGREIHLTADISYSVTAYIGPAETEQVEGFTITVCNFDYVNRIVEQQEFFDGRWCVIMENPTKDNIMKYFYEVLPQRDFKNWPDALQYLQLIGQSEFEDYKEYIE